MDRPDELIRLRALADTYDPVSRSQIEGLTAAPGSRCLDVGAGSGTIATWLSEHVPTGQVVALDRDTRILARATQTHPNVRVVEADLTDTGLDLGSFDLMDFVDLTMYVATDQRWAHVTTALWTSLTATIGTDISWGRRYPTLLRHAGLSDVGVTVHLPSADSASPGATFWRLTLATKDR